MMKTAVAILLLSLVIFVQTEEGIDGTLFLLDFVEPRQTPDNENHFIDNCLADTTSGCTSLTNTIESCYSTITDPTNSNQSVAFQKCTCRNNFTAPSGNTSWQQTFTSCLVCFVNNNLSIDTAGTAISGSESFCNSTKPNFIDFLNQEPLLIALESSVGQYFTDAYGSTLVTPVQQTMTTSAILGTSSVEGSFSGTIDVCFTNTSSANWNAGCTAVFGDIEACYFPSSNSGEALDLTVPSNGKEFQNCICDGTFRDGEPSQWREAFSECLTCFTNQGALTNTTATNYITVADNFCNAISPDALAFLEEEPVVVALANVGWSAIVSSDMFTTTGVNPLLTGSPTLYAFTSSTTSSTSITQAPPMIISPAATPTGPTTVLTTAMGTAKANGGVERFHGGGGASQQSGAFARYSGQTMVLALVLSVWLSQALI
ncbi:MAG: hypothetical protein M1827_006787 [Pycnora praestabilis]|nr:MAG: hypothetical protein M1827_006787 [Pycnora praestabilis]